MTCHLQKNWQTSIADKSDRLKAVVSTLNGTNEHEKYCSAQGSHYSERFANQTHIVAFSDPNDILSYSIPEGFKDKHLDSRMCTTVSNVILNVANVVDVLSFDIANPMEAHLGYDHDERVVALIAHGLSYQNMAPVIEERCNWTELTH